MITLNSSDFRSLDNFEYLYWWVDPSTGLSPSLLAQIRLLKEEKVGELWAYEQLYIKELFHFVFSNLNNLIDSSALYAWIQHIDIHRDDWSVAQKVGQQTLITLEPQESQSVIVMWSEELAVTVPWPLFLAQWDDFCSIGAEDAAVWPLSEEWFLYFHHEEHMVFGKPVLPMLDAVSRKPPIVQKKLLVHRDELLRLIKVNKKIEAIKLYHQETGCSLKESLDAVNSIIFEIRNLS